MFDDTGDAAISFDGYGGKKCEQLFVIPKADFCNLIPISMVPTWTGLCPGNHRPKKKHIPNDDYWCDVCSENLPKGDSVYNCRKCNWDCCVPCYARESVDKVG